MYRFLLPALLLAIGTLVCAASPAYADFSACASAFEAKDQHQKIDLYTSCLKHGGLASTDVAGAFNNRGIAYENLGEIDKALQDYISATQYDPGWPNFRMNRARAEARKGQCPEALADLKALQKMAPHRKEFEAIVAQIQTACPVDSKPAT